MQISIRTAGFPQVRTLLTNIAAAGAAAAGPIISLTNKEPYAYGIETGRHRGGRLARRAGGAFMYKRGIEKIRPQIAPRLGKAILAGPGAVVAEKKKLNDDAVAAVVELTPKRSGNLRAGVAPSTRPGGL